MYIWKPFFSNVLPKISSQSMLVAKAPQPIFMNKVELASRVPPLRWRVPFMATLCKHTGRDTWCMDCVLTAAALSRYCTTQHGSGESFPAGRGCETSWHNFVLHNFAVVSILDMMCCFASAICICWCTTKTMSHRQTLQPWSMKRYFVKNSKCTHIMNSAVPGCCLLQAICKT